MSGDYEVGYGKPPRHSQFQPGQSGNPAGRPKAPQTLASDLREELGEMITLGDGDTERTVSRQRAILGSLMAKALEGDAKAIAMVLDLAQRLIGAKPEYETEYGDIDFEVARERVARRIAELARQMTEQGSSESRESSKPETNGDDPEPRS